MKKKSMGDPQYLNDLRLRLNAELTVHHITIEATQTFGSKSTQSAKDFLHRPQVQTLNQFGSHLPIRKHLLQQQSLT